MACRAIVRRRFNGAQKRAWPLAGGSTVTDALLFRGCTVAGMRERDRPRYKGLVYGVARSSAYVSRMKNAPNLFVIEARELKNLETPLRLWGFVRVLLVAMRPRKSA